MSSPAPRLRVLSAPRRRRRRRLFGAIAFGALAWLLAAAIAAALYFSARALALSPATVAYWDGVARCETGGHWRGLGRTYQGGLGFYWATWDSWATELGLEARYPDAGDAPRLVQIRVADYGRRVHRGYWGCA